MFRRLALTLLALLLVLPALAVESFPEAPPLRIGVGGDYPAGLDGLLNARGLPHERVFPWELADPAVLSRYEVLLLSCPLATRGDLDGALLGWLKAGGRAYVEAWPAMQGTYPLASLANPAGNTSTGMDVLLTDTTHAITRRLDASHSIDTFHLTGTILWPGQADQMTVLARYCPDGGGAAYGGGAAVFTCPVGQGRLVYSGAPLSFTLFHRGPTTEPFMLAILDYLTDGRAVPRLTSTPPADETATVAAPPALDLGDYGKLSADLQAIETASPDPYDVFARLSLAGQSDRETVLVLDGRFTPSGKAARSGLWLTVSRHQLQLRTGSSSRGTLLASTRWEAPAGAVDLQVKRRSDRVTVVLGSRALLTARTTLKPGGLVACTVGGALRDVRYQPVAEVAFSDDFMRQPNDPNPWTNASGYWYVVGLGDGQHSVNGFYFRSAGNVPSLSYAGEPWWEDYTCSVSVMPEGPGTVGLAVLRQEGGDHLALLADVATPGAGAVRLVRVVGGKETVLASRPGGLAPRQWYRLAVRLGEGNLDALLDGQRLLRCALPEARGGEIALLTNGGPARFDDVLVQPASEALATPRREGTPDVLLPVSLGPQDSLSWASPAAPWHAVTERPSLLWHTGDFGRGLTCSLRLEPVTAPARRRIILAPDPSAGPSAWLVADISLQPGADSAELSFSAPGGKTTTTTLRFGQGGLLSLVRQGATTTALWNRDPVARADNTAALRRVGLEVVGPPVPVQALQVLAPEVRDYVFGVAPTDWHVSAGTWEVASRWACDSRWSWFAGWGEGDFAVWNKHAVDGDVALDWYVGVKMQAPGGRETTRCRDLNATLCGDQENPRSGYSFVLGGDDGVKTQLLRQGVVVAEAPDLRVPAGYGIHHDWFHVRAARVGRTVTLEFEGRPVLRYDDPEPLPGGYVGLWSRDSGILIPRVTIYR